MTRAQAPRAPFDEGVKSASASGTQENPFDEGTVEYRNFELGRAYAIRHRSKAPPWARQPK